MPVPFPVPDYRFDQKNEVFKRAAWDETMMPRAQRFYRDVVYQDRAGYRKLDFALRNAGWNLEWSRLDHAFGYDRALSARQFWPRGSRG
jgi:hypothetical protein